MFFQILLLLILFVWYLAASSHYISNKDNDGWLGFTFLFGIFVFVIKMAGGFSQL